MKKKYELQKIKNYLICASIIALSVTFLTKKIVFGLRREVIFVEDNIRNLEKEKYMLEIEWSYLVSPERLMTLLSKINKTSNKKGEDN